MNVDPDGSIYIRGQESIAARHFLEGHIFNFSAPNSLSSTEPCPIAATKNGLVYYTFNYQIIKRLSLGGANTTFIGELPENDRSLFDVATHRLGNVFVLTAPWQVYKLDGNGKYITQFNFIDDFLSNAPDNYWYSYITTDSQDSVYVLDSTNGKVLKFKEVS